MSRLRDSLIREEGDPLWLAAGVPRRWFAPAEMIEMRAAPTYFGPVSYRMQSSASDVQTEVALPKRNLPRTDWLVIRAPDGRQLRAVEIDRKTWKDFDAAGEQLCRPLDKPAVKVSARF